MRMSIATLQYILLGILWNSSSILGYCTSSSCRAQFSFSSRTYCCRDGFCCDYSKYRSQRTIITYRRWGTGSIVGTVFGNLLFILICVAVCWYFCFRKRARQAATARGVVVSTPVGGLPPSNTGQDIPGQQVSYGIPPQPMPQPFPTGQPIYLQNSYQDTQFTTAPSVGAPPSYNTVMQSQYPPYPVK